MRKLINWLRGLFDGLSECGICHQRQKCELEATLNVGYEGGKTIRKTFALCIACAEKVTREMTQGPCDIEVEYESRSTVAFHHEGAK